MEPVDEIVDLLNEPEPPAEIIIEERVEESDSRVFEKLPMPEPKVEPIKEDPIEPESEPEPIDEVEVLTPSEINNERLIESVERLEDSYEHLPIQREEIKEIKQGTRGYSVNVPQPKNIWSADDYNHHISGRYAILSILKYNSKGDNCSVEVNSIRYPHYNLLEVRIAVSVSMS